MKTTLYILLAILVAAVIATILGPRPSADDTITFDKGTIGDDPEQYLRKIESDVSNLRPGTEKGIVWHDPLTRSRTDLGLIYFHGFSATKKEIQPVPDIAAQGLSANLLYTRLKGHGRDGDAMGEATLQDWANDAAEAIAIGESFAERLILIGTSTGGTLATWAAAQPQLSEKIIGLVLVSPNFALHDISIGMMNMPWAETVLPLVGGKERAWEPRNTEQGKWWTTRYPTKAIFPMGALMKKVEGIEKSSLNMPALFIYSRDDKVVVPEKTEEIAELWGGPVKTLIVENPGDPYSHVIAGDIMSPTNTRPVAEAIIEWAENL